MAIFPASVISTSESSGRSILDVPTASDRSISVGLSTTFASTEAASSFFLAIPGIVILIISSIEVPT